MLRKIFATILGLSLFTAAFLAFDLNVFKTDSFFNLKVGSEVSVQTNSVLARALSLVCPGPGFVELSAKAGAARFGHSGRAQIAANQNGASNFASAEAPVSLISQEDALPQGSSLLSANQTQQFSAPATSMSAGANGLIGADCVRPASEFWFLGASTAVGRQPLLIVHNPSQVNSTFDIEIFDESGSVQASGMQGLSVMAGKTLVLPLAGFVPSDPALTVHVSSQGGAVAAWVQQKTVRGLVAAGIDFISPSSPATNDAVLPGMQIVGSKAAKAIAKLNPDYADLKPLLRVFVPKASAGKAKKVNLTVLVSGIDAKTFGTVVRQAVGVGQTTDISLEGLGDGTYSVEVRASKPVLASLKLSRNAVDEAKVLTATGSDFTWMSAAEPTTSARDVMVSSLGKSALNIVTRAGQPASVEIQNLVSGQVTQLELAASTIKSVPVAAGQNLLISADTPVYANLTTLLGTGIATFKVLDSKNLGGQVSTQVR
ncbi:MAG: hypothetical protein RL196_361 [Actinomycetota bacterium]|jgi:hypothetical protein